MNIAITAFIFCALPAYSAEQNDLDEQLRVGPGQSVLRSLPPESVIAANLICGEKWYVLSASEILAVRNLLKQERTVLTENVFDVYLPPLVNLVVLWGIEDGKIVPLDVLAMDDSVTVLFPRAKDKHGWYHMVDRPERECLLKLMKRIEAGEEQPVAQALTDKEADQQKVLEEEKNKG